MRFNPVHEGPIEKCQVKEFYRQCYKLLLKFHQLLKSQLILTPFVTFVNLRYAHSSSIIDRRAHKWYPRTYCCTMYNYVSMSNLTKNCTSCLNLLNPNILQTIFIVLWSLLSRSVSGFFNYWFSCFQNEWEYLEKSCCSSLWKSMH